MAPLRECGQQTPVHGFERSYHGLVQRPQMEAYGALATGAHVQLQKVKLHD